MNNGTTLILDAFWVSNKPFPTQLTPSSKEGKAFHNFYSGTARNLGWMDLVLLNDIINRDNIKHIILQNLDTLGKISYKTQSAKVCLAYEYNHHIIKTFSQNCQKELRRCRPIYRGATFGGWDFSDDDDAIPLRAQEYMRFLLLHTRVDSITCMTNKVKVTAHWDEFKHVQFDTEPNL